MMTQNTYYTPEGLLQKLDEWNLEAKTIQHEPLFTVDDCSALVDALPGTHCKSLFLKNKKKKFFLVVMTGSNQLDINALSSILGGGRLSFCTPEQLYEKLGLTPGSVTPFGFINPTSRDITLILEKSMMNSEILNYHPLINTMTTSIKSENLLKFFELIDLRPTVMDLPIKTAA
jgi:Ala-tRNA(Pro) deacylase